MGIITKIEEQKKNKKRVSVFIDEEYAFSCDQELVYTFKLKVQENIDINYIKQLVEEDNFIRAKRNALNILEKSNKSEKEITDKLLSKGYEDGIIQRVLEFLRKYEFVNDIKYAEAFIKDKLGAQGSNKIIYSLKRKGISIDIIKNTLQDMDSDSELQGALKLGKKKFELLNTKEFDKRKVSQKLSQYLYGRGYSWEIINRILKLLLNDESFEE